VFLLQHTEFNPLISALPNIMRVSLSRAGELHNLSGVARLMAQEIERKAMGSGFIVERLLEVLCAESVRAHVETTSSREANWFGAIKDPVLGLAISAVHLRPRQAWTVQGLAREAAMSPSRFAARFSESLGISPMAYVTRWRMNVACRHLAGTKQGVDQVAASVGYESVAAFNRAFKKHLGLPPAAWRAQQRA
jgi:AraC-like DNA-binding protein